MSVGIVIVSHSAQLAAGVVEFAGQMSGVGGDVIIAAAGGMDDGTLGTSVAKVTQALELAASPEGTLVLVDLGSAGLTAAFAIEQLPPERRALVRLSNAPLVEGAFAATIQSAIGSSLDEVVTAAEQATRLEKIPGGTENA